MQRLHRLQGPAVRSLALTLVFAGVSFVFGLVAPEADAAGDMDCSDFATQAAAQTFFNNHDPAHDPDLLDADGDGIACESNPCPCSTSTTPTTQPSGTVQRTRARVIRVVDGDTLLVGMPSGARRYVRILGIIH